MLERKVKVYLHLRQRRHGMAWHDTRMFRNSNDNPDSYVNRIERCRPYLSQHPCRYGRAGLQVSEWPISLWIGMRHCTTSAPRPTT